MFRIFPDDGSVSVVDMGEILRVIFGGQNTGVLKTINLNNLRCDNPHLPCSISEMEQGPRVRYIL